MNRYYCEFLDGIEERASKNGQIVEMNEWFHNLSFDVSPQIRFVLILDCWSISSWIGFREFTYWRNTLLHQSNSWRLSFYELGIQDARKEANNSYRQSRG